MAELTKNSIELLKGFDEKGKPVLDGNGKPASVRYFTSPFISLELWFEANDALEKYEGKPLMDMSSKELKDYMEIMADIIANKIYDKQFTKEELIKRYHAPGAIFAFQEQVAFVASGAVTDDTKKFLAKNR